MLTYVVLFNVPYNDGKIMLVTNELNKVIDMVRDTKANRIQIWSCNELLNDFNFSEECDFDSYKEYVIISHKKVLSFIKYITDYENMDIRFKFFDKTAQCEVSTKDINIVLKNIESNNTDSVTSFINENKVEYCCGVDDFKKYFIEELSKELNKQ